MPISKLRSMASRRAMTAASTAVLVLCVFLATDAQNHPDEGAFRIKNSVPERLDVHCTSWMLKPVSFSIPPGYRHEHTFDARAYVYPWFCTFRRTVNGAVYGNEFDVWNQNGTYGFLWNCFRCAWEVKVDGFYILLDDGIYYNRWPWYLKSAPGRVHRSANGTTEDGSESP